MTSSAISGRLFVLSAPSGAGKTSLIRALIASQPDVQMAISHTTRDNRPDEQHGVDYYFVSESQFLAMQNEELFIESAQVFGNLYGTSHAELDRVLAQGRHLILEIDWQGAGQIRSRVPGAVTIFILPPSLSTLRHRLLNRDQDDRQTIEQRMDLAIDEMSHFREFDFLVINDDFDQALSDLKHILLQQGDTLRLEWQLQHCRPLLSALRLIDD